MSMSIPEHIAAKLVELGPVEWGATEPMGDLAHGAHVANSVALTAEHFGQTEPQRMHGLYLNGTETVVCHTGTSPNAAVIAQALAGAWNWLVEEARSQETTPGAPA